MAKNIIKPKLLLSQEELKSLLTYETETGNIYWNIRPEGMFSSLRAARVWNSRYAGKEALACINAYGYKEGRLFNSLIRAHRVIWAMHFGKFDGDIDHINGVRTDNRVSNLRVVSRAENLRNTARRYDNKSGVTGVTKRRSGWRAFISNVEIGTFPSFEEAFAARKAAEVEFGFHPNHGRA